MSLSIAVEEGIAYITLTNPPLNVLSNKVKSDIKEAFYALAKNENVRVVLFGASGNHFCYGADLKEFPDRIMNNGAEAAWIDGHEMLQSILDLPQPSIVCVRGNALGGGAELVSAFDIRLFADDAVFGYPEVSRAVFPGNGGLERFIQLSGEANAIYLFLTGERLNALDAMRIGMANKVVEKSRLEDEGKKTAKLLASYSFPAIETIKKTVKSCRQDHQFYQIGMENFASLHQTDDITESINAFFEKRSPVYKHQ